MQQSKFGLPVTATGCTRYGKNMRLRKRNKSEDKLYLLKEVVTVWRKEASYEIALTLVKKQESCL